MFGYTSNDNKKGGICMEGLLLRSIEENIPLVMIYLSEDQQISQRKLFVKEYNSEYIRAYCLLRKQIRTFRRENILSIMPNSRTKLLH
jgi:predicted DNA-binding transcriptional regulator YafY